MNEFGEQLQHLLDESARTEAPKRLRLELALNELNRLLAEGRISQREYFERLMNETEPTRTIVIIPDLAGGLDCYGLERTEDGRINFSIDQVGTLPAVTIWVGLSPEGELIVEQVDAVYFDDEKGILKLPPGQPILFDQGEIDRAEFGRDMLEALLSYR